MTKEALEFGTKVFNHGCYSSGTPENFEKLLSLFNFEVNTDIEDVVLKNIDNTKYPHQKIDKIYKLPLYKYIVFLQGGDTFLVYEFIPTLNSAKITGGLIYAEIVIEIFLPLIFNKDEISRIIKELQNQKINKLENV